MIARPTLRAIDAFRSAIPIHPSLTNHSGVVGDLTICIWNTPWIDGFTLSANDDLTIAYHRRGDCDVRARIDSDWSARRSQPGQLTCIPGECESAFKVAGEVSFETIHIPNKRMKALARRHGIDAQSADFRFAFQDAFVGACIDAVVGEALEPNPWSEQFIWSVTDSLLLHLLRLSAEHAHSAGTPIDRVRALIEQSMASSLSLQEMSRAAGLSRSYLARRFRQETGVSPHRYQSERRIARAKEMLRGGEMSLVDIAMELGFCSQSHFTQVFRSLVGVTPRKYRDSA